MFIELLNENGIEVIKKPKFMKDIDRSVIYMKKMPVCETVDNKKQIVRKEFICFVNISKNKCITFKDNSMKRKIVVKKKDILIFKWINGEWNKIIIPIKLIKG